MRKQILSGTLTVALAAILAAGAAFSQPVSSDAVMQKARNDGYAIRAGQWALAAPMVASLEAQTKIDPNNAALWTRLSGAYFMKAAAAINPKGVPGNPFPDFAAGKAAAEKAIALDPKLADAYAMRGVSTVILASFQNNMADMPIGMADLNRGVELDPKGLLPRLQRAFSAVNFPKEMRDNKAIEDDLNYLIKASITRRETDRLHMMLGDVFFETRKLDLAKAEYEIVAASGSTAAEDVALRLSALSRNQPPVPEFASLRSKTGQDCVSCHGQ
jgi:hypothetical protein